MESYFKNKLQEFYKILEKMEIKEEKELESFVHSLLDIEESFKKIYNVHVKNILDNENNDEVIKDNLWDIREEFRHIDYHINDANLTE